MTYSNLTSIGQCPYLKGEMSGAAAPKAGVCPFAATGATELPPGHPPVPGMAKSDTGEGSVSTSGMSDGRGPAPIYADNYSGDSKALAGGGPSVMNPAGVAMARSAPWAGSLVAVTEVFSNGIKSSDASKRWDDVD